MKKIALLFLSLLMLTAARGARRDALQPVRGIMDRRVPWLSGRMQLVHRADMHDAFTLTTLGGRPAIEAGDALSAAVGLNWYLKYYCHRQMSYLGDNLAPVDSLPLPATPETHRSAAAMRYALNYCTQNYTYAFYSWADWERELDWMALHGVNTMLICTGHEAVWQATMRRMGYTDEEVRAFIPGPAYTAWWLMGNLEGTGGPMPQTQIDGRARLTRQIIARMKELGMEPMLPGFYGMVPASTGGHFPKARIVKQGIWCDMRQPDFMLPTDPLFARMARVFYAETRRLYGKNIRYFSGDPFHEGGRTEGVDLPAAGLAIQKAMLSAYPAATWVLQGWGGNPQPRLIERMDKQHVLIQELQGSRTSNWERRKGYEGTPFIWCDIANFGERPGFCGKLQRVCTEWQRVLHSPYSNLLRGIGIMPEGIRNNPVIYELILELPWHQGEVKPAEWLTNYARARYGRSDSTIEAAWQGFLGTIYSSSLPVYTEGPFENILMARPDRAPYERTSLFSTAVKTFSLTDFTQAARAFLGASSRFKGSETYLADALQLQAQLISLDADAAYAGLQAALARKDSTAFAYHARQMLLGLDAIDRVMDQSPLYRLSTYIDQAINQAATPQERRVNVANLLAHITYWGGEDPKGSTLTEYAYKEWSGLTRAYYRPRWQSYFDYELARMQGRPATAPDYGRRDRQWVRTATDSILANHP